MSETQHAQELEDVEFPYHSYLVEQASSDEAYGPPEEDGSDIGQALSGTFEERLAILREAIEEIDLEIGLRVGMSRAFKGALQGESNWIGFKLRQFDRWHWGDKPSVDFRRTALERELLSIYREMRSQSQRAFTDIAGLKKERRKLLMEYKSLRATEKMVSQG
ncbi:MAG: hypothetical protein KJ621_11760 [Proteobacteria bacterium]|nr:hypothetical protein [Pseudomonadota bacterium]